MNELNRGQIQRIERQNYLVFINKDSRNKFKSSSKQKIIVMNLNII